MSVFRRGSAAKLSADVLTSANIKRCGYLHKRGSWFKSWKLRYHVLRIDTSSLDYLETAESTSTLGSIRIDAFTAFVNATPAEADGYSNAAFIVSDSGSAQEMKHLLRFDNAASRDGWGADIMSMVWDCASRIPSADSVGKLIVTPGRRASSTSTYSLSDRESGNPVGEIIKEGWTSYGRKFYAMLAGRTDLSTKSDCSSYTTADINRAAYLSKRGHWFKSWKRRYFILRKDLHELHYFEDHLSLRLLGKVSLDTSTTCTIVPEEESDGFAFVMKIRTNGSEPHILKFNFAAEMEAWKADILAEASQVYAIELGARVSSMSKEELVKYLSKLTQEIRVMKEELSNVNNLVPSMTSQMNARAENIRASQIGGEAMFQMKAEISRLNDAYRVLTEEMGDSASEDITELKAEINREFNSLSAEIENLMVDRRATMAHSNMTTTSFLTCVSGLTLYRFVAGNGPVAADPSTVDAARIRRFHMTQDMPAGLKYATITAQWILAESNIADDQNILGGTGKLMVMTDEKLMDVPVMDATEELLSYYRAHLLQDGDCFHFETKRDYPLFMMDIGENYVNEFIMKKKKGLYFEWHNEPHYHEPVNAETRGSYCLAREVPCDDPDLADSEVPWKTFHITCFRIPLGTACYSEPYAIHDDAPTIGEWRVGYIDAEHYSTVTIFNCELDHIGFNFSQQ